MSHNVITIHCTMSYKQKVMSVFASLQDTVGSQDSKAFSCRQESFIAQGPVVQNLTNLLANLMFKFLS